MISPSFQTLFPNPPFHSNAPGSLPLRRLAASLRAANADTNADSVHSFMRAVAAGRCGFDQMRKMARRSNPEPDDFTTPQRWFPYLDLFLEGRTGFTSAEVVQLLGPHIPTERKERMQRAVANRSYSLCLVAEDVADVGNVAAAFRSAEALGIQSVHIVSSRTSTKYRHSRYVSKGAEKWLDIEQWKSSTECFGVLKRRGYRIVTTDLGNSSVSIYDLDWSQPTAVVVGNEFSGVSSKALQLSDLHCDIPMTGMVGSFNVTVAASILMHHAVYDRVLRLGRHGDLMPEERQILLAEFYLRNRETSTCLLHEFSKRKSD